ncbi:SDR family NAD(P)-dependent oxidoreductase [Rouxiella badensis]|uniref:Short-chain dehydrogenase n=1 Tax=Rouxiella badensis TaxID=1646377 RepID=A0A1X0WGI5_9GAMM|nr:SDR family NAD(P)-dependent oxidoreductase [Rouxiella badensis]ORJ25927.1 short-chain dehydrogenase [Rouxiella badensis]WAT04317.1 SDR family NAD(P)-dependent oxidoreductase [Rouxiella badensis]
MSDLNDKIALVTGGAKGIGRAICLELAARGAKIALVYRRDGLSAEKTAQEIRLAGGQVGLYQAELTERQSVNRAVAQVVADWGAIDILVNNAGASAPASLLELNDSQWQQVLQFNATGCFITSTEVAKVMLARGGSIISIAGASAHRCYPGAGAFGPSKAAVVNLTTQMAMEWAQYGIRVNGVSPGPIREADDGWQQQEPALAEEVTRLPLRRAGTPREVAKAVCYLASEDAGYTTGQMLIVDGGGVCTWYLAP